MPLDDPLLESKRTPRVKGWTTEEEAIPLDTKRSHGDWNWETIRKEKLPDRLEATI